MIYHLLWYLHAGEKLGFYAYQNVIFRSVAALLTSLLIALLIGPRIIRWLMTKKIGDRPEFHHATLNELTKEKANTPTMGGLIILFSIITSTLLWAKLYDPETEVLNPYVAKGLFVIVWFGILGSVDDWLKLTSDIRHRNRDGLRVWEKLVFQIGGAVLVASFLYLDFASPDDFGNPRVPDGIRFWLPFYSSSFPVGKWMFIIISLFYLTATSNAVNLTDGMDGLAAGCVAMVSLVLVLLCYVASETMGGTAAVTWSSYLLLPAIPAGELSI